MRPGAWVFAILMSGALSGCSYIPIDSIMPSSKPAPAPAPTEPAAAPSRYSVGQLVGNWGVASYRDEKDRKRVEAQARSQCKLPYVIAKGPTDGVMMHVADDTTPHELTLKGGPDGKTYLGFAGPPGDDQDREILSLTDKMFVARYINPETNSRYGTFVYIRCGKA